MKDDWQSIYSIIIQNKKSLKEILIDDDIRHRALFFAIFIIFAAVTFVMSIVNVITGFKLLTVLTVSFCFASVINFILTFISKKAEFLSHVLFSAEMIILLYMFVMYGEPEGFSAIWAVILPACGLFLYGLKVGSILSLIEFLIIIFFFWFPLGKSLLIYQDYTSSFMLRFPLLYMACFFCGVMFEFIRAETQKQLVISNENYKHLYVHDALTEVYNRMGFNRIIDEKLEEILAGGYGFAILDIDDFKQVNDTYGHSIGDVVLKTVAKDIEKIVGDKGYVCRWGGEEFAILFMKAQGVEEICEEIIRNRNESRFNLEGFDFKVTISIGVVIAKEDLGFRTAFVVNSADAELYKAKRAGKNRTSTRYLTKSDLDDETSLY